MPRPLTKEPNTEIGKARLAWVKREYGTVSAFCGAAGLTQSTGRRWVYGGASGIDMTTVRKLRAVAVPENLILEP